MSNYEKRYENRRKASIAASNGLTGIPTPIHCPATQNTPEAGYDELDRIAIDNFLDTLAEIAINIAAREAEAY